MGVVRETRRNLLIMTAVVACAALFAFLASFAVPDAEFKKTLQTSSLTLIFGALLGGLVKLLLDDFDRGRQQRAEQAQFCLNVLSDLKSVYDQTERAKVLISGHQSAKTYGDEMRGLIEARVKILNVIRAVKVQSIGLVDDERLSLIDNVSVMEKYIEILINDFQHKYKNISEKQRMYEAVIKAYIDKVAKEELQDRELPDNEPWAGICELESMQDFLDLKEIGVENTNYHKQFVSQLDKASDLLTKQLQRVLG